MMSSKNVQSATSFHSDIASDFDDKYQTSVDFIERFEVWTRFLAKYIPPRSRVLDAGCGSGIFSFYLCLNGAKVIGIDGAAGMVALCNKKKEREQVQEASFIQESLPLDVSKFEHCDAIISSSVLEYVPEFDAAISGFNELLLANGVLILSLPNKESLYKKLEQLFFKATGRPEYLKHTHNIFSLSNVNSRMRKLGFVPIESEYYAANYRGARFLGKILGLRYCANLFLVVYKKD